MKNKLKSCAILATLGAITIHLINKTLIEMATKDSLLNSSEGNYYDWRFGKIYYRKQGNGKPLLLLHDLDAESSGVEWKKVAAILAEKYTVYTVDLLGCGRSEKPNITYTNFLYVQMLTDFIKHIIGEKADVVATGESAAIAVMACGNDENVIGKICMVNPLSLTELAKCPNKRTKTLKFLIEIPIIGTLLYNIIHSREAIDEKFVDKYLYDEDTIDYQMTKYTMNLLIMKTHIQNICLQASKVDIQRQIFIIVFARRQIVSALSLDNMMKTVLRLLNNIRSMYLL